MTRLLHAAARGARIQRLWFKMRDEPYNWEKAHVVSVATESDYDYRIHPEDEALQYGPISSALREDAEIAPAYYIDPRISEEAIYVIGIHSVRLLYDMADELHRSLFLLILAEALADEGM